MRISDWSSDVCSSDLVGNRPPYRARIGVVIKSEGGNQRIEDAAIGLRQYPLAQLLFHHVALGVEARLVDHQIAQPFALDPQHGLELVRGCGDIIVGIVEQRSEEHTSELQSLMRISYAVFCLKKK